MEVGAATLPLTSSENLLIAINKTELNQRKGIKKICVMLWSNQILYLTKYKNSLLYIWCAIHYVIIFEFTRFEIKYFYIPKDTFTCGGAHCLWWVGPGSQVEEKPTAASLISTPAAALLGSSTSHCHVLGHTVTHSVYTLHRSHASSSPVAPLPRVTNLTSRNMKLIKGHSTPEFLTKSFVRHPNTPRSTECMSQSEAEVL